MPSAGRQGCHGETKRQQVCFRYLPKVHAVDERRGAVSGPQAAVGELGDVPHELVHDLRELDGVSRRAGTTTSSARSGAVSDVALVVGAVEVRAIPASKMVIVSYLLLLTGQFTWTED